MNEIIGKIAETTDKAIKVAAEVVDNDKTLVIFTLLVFGVLAMAMRIEGCMSLVDKLSAGLLGMAIGRTFKP